MKHFLNTLFYLFFHPMLLAFYVCVIVVYFIPDYFEKNKADILSTEYLPDFGKVFYWDLNNDGISEKIKTGYNDKVKNISIQHFDLTGRVYNQWGVSGKWLKKYKPYFGDFNHNGYDEVYVLSYTNDSIFLSIKELMLDTGVEISNRFVCKYGTFNKGEADIVDWGGKLMDIDGDSMKEYVFFIYGGFSKFPRNAFTYYITKDSLVKMPPSASCINRGLNFMDLNNDGVDEITGTVGSPENIHYPMHFTDSASWLMILNPVTMSFLFPPIRFNLGIGSSVSPVFFNLNGKKYIATSIYSNSAKIEINYSQLKLFDKNGNIINERNVYQLRGNKLLFFNPNSKLDNYFWLIDSFGEIYQADNTLNLSCFYKPKISNCKVDISKHFVADIDGDSQPEIIFYGHSGQATSFIFIYQHNLKEVLSLELPNSKNIDVPHFSLIHNGKGRKPFLSIQNGNYSYKIKYRKNPYYYLKFPAYGLLYLFLFLGFWLLQRIQNQFAKRKIEAENLLTKQQMTILRKQLEPHFVLNTLNYIGYMFSKENKEDALYYFGKFSSLIHRGLTYADKTEISLAEELRFVTDYLILQKKRFNDDLDFSIESDEEVILENILIPHSLVYTFTENAVKHGLRNKPIDRKLTIIVKNISVKTVITITDNGIGRKQSILQKTTGTGKGLDIITNIIIAYNKLNNRSVNFQVIDLVNEKGEGIGTKVVVEV